MFSLAYALGKTVSSNYKNFKEKVYNLTFGSQDDIIQIIPRVYWMTYPASDKIHDLSKKLQNQFNNNYYVWNLSEHNYNTEFFNNQVAIHRYPGYPCPPLYEIFVITRCILDWLTKDPENIAVIHCQNTKGRSILIISLLVAMINNIPPDQCFLNVCRMLKIDDNRFFPTQHQYLRYMCNSLNELPLNETKVRIACLIINQIPKILPLEGLPVKDFTPYIEIVSCGNKLIFSSLDMKNLVSYSQDEQGCIFYLNGIDVHQDTLLRVKHFQSENQRYPLFRTVFHTSFVFQNVLRLYERDLDISYQVLIDDQFFVDIIFEIGDEKCQQNVKDREEWNEINLSETEKEDYFDKEGNQLILKVIQQCKQSAKQFEKNNEDEQIEKKITENKTQFPIQIQQIKQSLQEENKQTVIQHEDERSDSSASQPSIPETQKTIYQNKKFNNRKKLIQQMDGDYEF